VRIWELFLLFLSILASSVGQKNNKNTLVVAGYLKFVTTLIKMNSFRGTVKGIPFLWIEDNWISIKTSFDLHLLISSKGFRRPQIYSKPSQSTNMLYNFSVDSQKVHFSTQIGHFSTVQKAMQFFIKLLSKIRQNRPSNCTFWSIRQNCVKGPKLLALN
jgi:hypothetical protein